MVTVWCLMCIEGVSFVKGEFSITSASNARSYIPLSHICFYCVSQDPDNGSCGSYPADRGPLNVILKLNISKRPCQFVKKHEFSESFCISKTLRKHAISQTCPSGWPVLTCVSCLLLVTHWPTSIGHPMLIIRAVERAELLGAWRGRGSLLVHFYSSPGVLREGVAGFA